MDSRVWRILASCGFLLSICVPASAHHGTGASYDMQKQVTLKGIVTEVVWVAPHTQLYFDVTDEKGNVVHWAGETVNPAALIKGNWTKNTLKPGDEVTVTVNPSKAGTPVGNIVKVILPNGKVFGRGGNAGQ